MKAIVSKLGRLRKEIAAKRGEFRLFVLALPEEAIAWDLLVAADWIDADQKAALRYLVEATQKTLTKQELLDFSGIIIIDTKQLAADESSAIESETGWLEHDIDFYGRHVQKVYVFNSPMEDFYVSVSR